VSLLASPKFNDGTGLEPAVVEMSRSVPARTALSLWLNSLPILHFESCSSNLGRVAERCSPMSMIAAQMHVALGGRENRCTAPRVVPEGVLFGIALYRCQSFDFGPP